MRGKLSSMLFGALGMIALYALYHAVCDHHNFHQIQWALTHPGAQVVLW